MAVNFLTLRSAVANDIAVQHLTYSTMVGHPIASHQTVQAITASSIMTMGHVGIGATTALSGTALNVVGSTMISGNVSIVGGATGDPLRVNNNKTVNDNNVSLILRNNMTPTPSQLGFILKTAGPGAYHTLVQTGDHLLLSFDQSNGVVGANGIVIGGWNQTAGLRIGTTSSAFNGDLAISGNITINNGVGGTLTKTGSTAGYYATFTGGTADNSPFLEFWAGGSRRCYMGNANTTEVQFASENGAQLKFLTGGTSRLTIATGGDITASSNLTANCLIINGGGTYQAGCIYSDINWGMLFRSKIVPSAGGGIFGWYDSAGTEKMKMLTDGSMTHTSGDFSYMKYGPNGQWSSYLVVGATPDRAGASTAQVITTNGNLHLDAGNSSDIYYGLYATQRATPNAHRFSGQVFISGDTTVNSALTGSEVYTNGWLRINGGGGVHWQTYGRGIYSADSAGASYGNVSVYGTGINTWNGYDINGRYTFMANGDTIGVHDKNNSWVWRNVNTVMYISKTLVLESVAQNSDYYSQVAVLNGTTLQKSQCMMRNIYFHNNVGWSGGVNMTYAFHRSNSICPLRISGKYSGFCGGNNMLQITIRIYSHAAGTYTYYYLNNFTNNGGNHHTVPLDHIVTDLPYTGWHDIYLYNSSGWSTDTNDQLTVNVQLLPVRDF